jgi:hypothetical protein
VHPSFPNICNTEVFQAQSCHLHAFSLANILPHQGLLALPPAAMIKAVHTRPGSCWHGSGAGRPAAFFVQGQPDICSIRPGAWLVHKELGKRYFLVCTLL